jgi:hypothetical protein
MIIGSSFIKVCLLFRLEIQNVYCYTITMLYWENYFYYILTTFNKLKIMLEVAHDNWKRLKLLIMYHKLVFDRENGSLECVNRVTRNNGQWQTVPVEYHMREKRFLSCWVLPGVIMKEEKCMCCDCFKSFS